MDVFGGDDEEDANYCDDSDDGSEGEFIQEENAIDEKEHIENDQEESDSGQDNSDSDQGIHDED